MRPPGFAAKTPSQVLLTPERKLRELAYLDTRIAEGRFTRAHEGGLGYLDEDVLPLVHALNELPGICTLQSCAGHPVPDECGMPSCEVPYAYSAGQLWLWLDRDVADAIWISAGKELLDLGVLQFQFIFGRIEQYPLLDLMFDHNDLDRIAIDLPEYFKRVSA